MPLPPTRRRELLLVVALHGVDAHGGYAEYAVVPAEYAYLLPDGYTADELGPLLCAGIIGYRALRRSALPARGRLGVYGFGASAHLATQVALAEGATVHVLTRAAAARELALSLGASSAAGADDAPPEPWTPLSCSPRRRASFRWPWRRSTRAGRSR